MKQVGPSPNNATTAEMEKNLTDSELEKLIDSSLRARQNSYSPYSKFAVGAALLTDAGEVIEGCNVENISYGLTVCAERTAVCSAVAKGYRKFRAIAISAEMGQRFVGPCGACRQTLAEFGLDWEGANREHGVLPSEMPCDRPSRRSCSRRPLQRFLSRKRSTA